MTGLVRVRKLAFTLRLEEREGEHGAECVWREGGRNRSQRALSKGV
jgi:hypothetical protein